MKCNQCNTEFEGKFCPNCGAPATNSDEPSMTQNNESGQTISSKKDKEKKKFKVKKPFYKKWWFILIVIIVVIAFISKIIGGNKSEGEKFSWSDITMGEVLPEPKSNVGKIYSNTDESLTMYIYDTSSSDYSEYVNKCEDMGFTIDTDKNSTSFEAYNESGYRLSVNYSDYSSETYMDIDLDAPIKMSKIQWPTSTVGNLLPVPKSTVGKFSYEHDDSFYVYIGETSEADYSEYVIACSDKGFNIDYDKGDTYYYADNNEGYHISLKYEGNSTMSISIDSPDETDKTTSSDTASDTNDTTSESSENKESTDNTASGEELVDGMIDSPDETDKTTSSDTASDTNDTTSESSENKESTDNTASGEELVDGMRVDFKEAMDSYEDFMDEYVAFMEKYSESDGTDASLLSDYVSYMTKYAECVEKLDKWESEDMNATETAYYIQVQSRVSQKLLDEAQ